MYMTNQSETDQLQLEVNAKKVGKKLGVEVIADNSGKFCGNGRRFDTAAEAREYAEDLATRWTLVREYRIAIVD
jgi:hypothetical protein